MQVFTAEFDKVGEMSSGTFTKSHFIHSPLNSRRPIDFIPFPRSGYKLASANKRKKFLSRRISFTGSAMDSEQTTAKAVEAVPNSSIKLLFVEMGVGYDQHGQDVTSAAMRACRNAISSNSIPAFRRGSIPGVSFGEMKLQIKLGVPGSLQHLLDMEKVKSIFPYGKITNVEVVDGGLICSSGVHVEEMGDKTDDCYIVNAAVYVGY